MTSDSPPFLNPDLAAKISKLELRAREIVEGLVSGRHASPFRGRSIEFAQHREYSPGDDLRFLDWKVWAKSDRYYVKEFEEETNLRASLLLDASGSMDYGEGARNKFEFACTLAAALAYLLLRQSDAVGLWVLDDRAARRTAPSDKRGRLRTMLDAMASTRPSSRFDFEAAVARAVDPSEQRGLFVLISDLLAPLESVTRGLRLLRRRRRDLIVLHVLHDDELDFEFVGPTRFEGLEDPLVATCDPRGLRAAYVKAMQAFVSEARRTCGRAGADYRLARTSEPVDAVLASLLRKRMRA